MHIIDYNYNTKLKQSNLYIKNTVKQNRKRQSKQLNTINMQTDRERNVTTIVRD